MSKRPKKERTIAETITARRNAVLDRKGYFDLFVRIIFIAIVLWVFLNLVFAVTVVSGNDMFPSFKDGDVVLGFRLEKEYSKNDVVIYTISGESRVGRIAARGGDVVTLDDSGTLIVNGTVQSGEIIYSTYAKDTLTYPYTVPENSFFILGDMRTQSTDSRDFGAVADIDVTGKVITLLRRRGL